MAQLALNAFTQYQLSDEEERSGHIFNYLNICVLQNMMATIALQRLSLPVDTTNILRYAQEEAEMKGQIMLLQQLIAVSMESEASLVGNSNPFSTN